MNDELEIMQLRTSRTMFLLTMFALLLLSTAGCHQQRASPAEIRLLLNAVGYALSIREVDGFGAVLTHGEFSADLYYRIRVVPSEMTAGGLSANAVRVQPGELSEATLAQIETWFNLSAYDVPWWRVVPLAEADMLYEIHRDTETRTHVLVRRVDSQECDVYVVVHMPVGDLPSEVRSVMAGREASRKGLFPANIEIEEIPFSVPSSS